MKTNFFKLVIILGLIINYSFSGYGQQGNFRLQVQAAKAVLMGDGDDYTTIVITARDSMGEIDTRVNGPVELRINAGIYNPLDIKMVEGVAVTNLIAPMFGTPIKGAHRMVYFMFKFMKTFISKGGKSADASGMQDIAVAAAKETILSGTENPFTIMPKKSGDDYIYIVAEIKGVKGKAKVKIEKASEGPNGNILPGHYEGEDITGGQTWTMDISSAGEGLFGAGSGSESNTILFTNEASKEVNDAMGKLYGIGGFMKAYLGPSLSETKYVPNYNIRTMGMETPYLPMPKNGVFIYVPPVLLEYQPASSNQAATGTNEPPQQMERAFVEVEGNQLIGDGQSQTTAVFSYHDAKGNPVVGKSITWKPEAGLTIVKSELVTDSKGQARAVLQAPLIKAKSLEVGSTLEYKDATALYELTVYYASAERPNDNAHTYVCVYKTVERKIRIIKPGFDIEPVKVLLPLIKHFTFESNVYSLIEPFKLPSIPDKIDVYDAAVVVESDKFNEAFFKGDIQLLKKDKKKFAESIRDFAKGFVGFTDKEGKFKIKIGAGSSKTFKVAEFKVNLSDLTGRRKGALLNVIDLINDNKFTDIIRNAFFRNDKDLCQLSYEKAVFVEEKLHILGGLMTHANSASKYMDDTNEELITKAWEAITLLAEWANEKYKLSDWAGKKLEPYTKKLSDLQNKVGEKTGYNSAAKTLEALKSSIDSTLVRKITGYSYKQGLSGLIKRFMYKTFSNPETSKTARLKCSQKFYALFGDAGDKLVAGYLQSYIDTLSTKLAEYLVPKSLADAQKSIEKSIETNISKPFEEATDVKGMIKKAMISAYYASLKADILRYIDTDPERVHKVYEDLRPLLLDRSKDLGTYYLSVANWRYKGEMAMAYKDLFADVILKGAVLYSAYKNPKLVWDIPAQFERIEKAKKALAAVYTGVALVKEIYSYNQLWAEAASSFVFANLSVYQGTTKLPTTTLNCDFEIIPKAYAAAPVAALPGVLNFGTTGLTLANGPDALLKVEKLYDGLQEMDEWLAQNSTDLLQLSLDQPAVVQQLLDEADQYNFKVQSIGFLTLAMLDNPEDERLQDLWHKETVSLEPISNALSKSSSAVVKGLEDLPREYVLPKAEPQGDGYNAISLTTWLIVGGSICLLFLVIVLVMRMRKKHKVKRHSNGTAIEKPVQRPVSIVEGPFASNAHTAQPPPRPKFCTQCGATLNPGVKFCGKCGKKLN